MAERDGDVVLVSDVIACGEARNVAEIHGKVIELSPIKTSRKNKDMKYFEGKITDGKSRCRFVSFDVKGHKNEMEAIAKKGESVAVRNVDVKKSAVRDELELIMSQKSTVMNSPKKFKFDNEEDGELKEGNATVVQQLDKLEDIENLAANCGNKVRIRGHVVSRSKKEEVKSKEKVLKMEEYMICDTKAKGYRLVLWEKACGCLKEGQSYDISCVSVRAYQGVKYFSAGEDCEFQEIDRVADEVCEKSDVPEKRKVIGEIDGIFSCAHFVACSSCGAKVCEMKNVIGQCSKCGLKQKMSRCKQSTSARVVIRDEGGNSHNVSMFSSCIELLLEQYDENYPDSSADIEEKMLEVGKKVFEINDGNVVVKVEELP